MPDDLSYLPGIGPKSQEKLSQIGITDAKAFRGERLDLSVAINPNLPQYAA